MASLSAVLGKYTRISGSFSGSSESFFSGRVGKGHDATTTSTNYYSSGSGSKVVFQYAIDLSAVPSNANITRLYMKANGHAESTSSSSEYMCVQLKSGNTTLSAQYNFKSSGTSNKTQTIEATTLPTVTQLSSLVVECTLGYYGGAINGVTVFVEYEVPLSNPELYRKVNGAWVKVEKAYKKVNGTWVEQSDITSVFSSSGKYVNGSGHSIVAPLIVTSGPTKMEPGSSVLADGNLYFFYK